MALWLGSPVTTTVPADLAAVGEQGDGPAIQKLDGCLYQSVTGALGYDVLSLAGWSTATQVDLVTHQIPETSGTQAFDPGIGAHSYGFTSPMGTSVFAVVHVLADDRLTTVSLTLQGATAGRRPTTCRRCREGDEALSRGSRRRAWLRGQAARSEPDRRRGSVTV